MKILIDTHLSENKLTGIGRYINNLIPALLKIDDTNEYHILIKNDLNPDHPLMKIKKNNVMKYVVDYQGLSIKQHWHIKKVIKKIKPDIYHHPHFDLPLNLKIPSVITIHDLKYIRNPEFFPNFSKFKKIYIKKSMKCSCQNCTKIISISEFTKNEIGSTFGISLDKIETIYHGIDFNNASMKVDAHNFLIENNINLPFVLFVGERRPHKNIDRLILAFKEVLMNLDLQLVIVGKSYKDYKKPENLVEQNNLQKNILFIDYIEDKFLKVLYRNAKIFVLPSLYEGFGFPVLEAMNFGVPVIGSNTTSLPEIIGDAGVLIDPCNVKDIAQKIRNLFKNDDLKNKLINCGEIQLKKFTWKKTAIKTLNIYHQALNTFD